MAGVEEHVLSGTETSPQLVVLTAVTARNLLPGAHQLTVRAGGLRPIGRGGQLLGASNQLFLRALDACVAVVQLGEVRAAVAIEGGAGGAETLPQLVLHALGQVNLALSLLPRLEQLVHAGVRVLPVNLVGVLAGNLLGLGHNLFTHCQGTFAVLGAGLLLLLAKFGNLLSEGDEALLQAGVVADHVAHANLRADGGDALLQIRGGGVIGQARLEQGDLRLNIFKLTGEVAERFIFGCAGQLTYGVLFAIDNDEDVAVLGDATKLAGLLEVYSVVGFGSHRYNSFTRGCRMRGGPSRRLAEAWAAASRGAPVGLCVCTS